MPELDLYWKASATAAIVGFVVTSAIFMFQKPVHQAWRYSIWILAIGVGVYSGNAVLELNLSWPPRNALERFLTLVLPMALAIEWIAGWESIPKWCGWLLRGSLAIALPRILIHGAVYLGDSAAAWSFWQAILILGGIGLLTLLNWAMLSWLSHRSTNISIALSLQWSILCAGLTIMMAGYIKGGATAFPLVGALTATTIAAWLMTRSPNTPTDIGSSTMIGIGLVGLVSLLFIGRFFGELSTGQAVVILLAPLLCWLTEIKGFQRRKPWLAGGIRVAVVGIPLLVVLILAKLKFDREMGPLLVSNRPPNAVGLNIPASPTFENVEHTLRVRTITDRPNMNHVAHLNTLPISIRRPSQIN